MSSEFYNDDKTEGDQDPHGKSSWVRILTIGAILLGIAVALACFERWS